MHTYILEMLQCPACHGELAWRVDRREGERTVAGEADCRTCHASYPIRDGIGIFLTPDLPRNDLWAKGGSSLLAWLKENPAVERALMESPIESLSPADLFYRAGVLDLRGRYAEARELEQIARVGLYTAEQRAATDRLFAELVRLLKEQTGPVFDLASGRGALAHTLLEQLPNPLVMTDFSPAILREDRQRLLTFGLYDRVSLLAFDARRTPLKSGAVRAMTTYGGLANIEQPGGLLYELRRVVAGRFMAIQTFYPEEDVVNGGLLRQAGMEQLFFRRLALQNFSAAGWQVQLREATLARVRPTPKGVLIPEATVDGFPVAEAEAEFTLIDAH